MPVVEIAPELLIIATPISDDVQVTCPVKLSVDPSLNVPVAVNCCGEPKVITGFMGLIAIELKVALDTVNEATPTCPANTAVTVTVPGAIPVAWPNDPSAALIVATVESDDVHCTEFVRSCVAPFVSVPVAFKGIDVPSATVPLPEIVIAVKAWTVKFAGVLVTPPSWQVTAAEPLDCPVTIPIALTVATVGAEDNQVATVSTCCVELSLNLAIACNARFESTVKPATPGVTVIDVSVAELTVSGTDSVAVAPPNVNVAEIVVAPPGATPVATPTLPAALLMVATPVLLLAHTTSCVMFCVLASLKVPMAVKPSVVNGAIVVLEDPTVIDWMVAVVTSSAAVPLRDSNVAVIVAAGNPPATPWARPVVAAIVATDVFDEVHAACPVMLCLLPSL